MIGIDTNILVRYIIQDEPEQSKQVTQFIEKTIYTEGTLIFINSIVLCELVWVLETAYEYSRQEIVNILEKILKIRQFHIYQPEIVRASLRDYRQLNIDFSDSYIAYLNELNDCEYTASFDKKAARLKNFKLLGAKKFSLSEI